MASIGQLPPAQAEYVRCINTLITEKETNMAWKPGESGNPGGSRSPKPFRDALRMQIAQAGDDLAALRRIAQKLLDKAEAGDLAAILAVADRLEGRPPQSIGGDAELGPTRLRIMWGNPTDSPSPAPTTRIPLVIDHEVGALEVGAANVMASVLPVLDD